MDEATHTLIQSWINIDVPMHDGISASNLPHLPTEIIGMIAIHLSSTRAFATLGSLCGVSKSHYYAFRPLLYRKFYLTCKSSFFLRQVIQILPYMDPDLVHDAQYQTAIQNLDADLVWSQDYGMTATAPFTSAIERAGMVTQFVIEEMPLEAINTALKLLLGSPLRYLDGTYDGIFGSLRNVVISEGLVEDWLEQDLRGEYELSDTLSALALLLHPTDLCIIFPTIPWPISEAEDWRDDTLSWGFMTAIQRMMDIRKGDPTAIKSISIHNIRVHDLPALGGVEEVDIYFAPAMRRTPALKLVGSPLINLCRRISELWEFSVDLVHHVDSPAQYRCHNVIEPAIMKRLQSERHDTLADLDMTQSDEDVLRQVLYKSLRTGGSEIFLGLDLVNDPLDDFDEEYKPLLDKHIKFLPAPSKGSRCQHCGWSLL